ncbi:MAG: MFS transporter [Chlamydiota bacterium]
MLKFSLFRRFLSLVGISSGCIGMGLVFTMVNTSIPSIQNSLGIPLHQMQWMMIAFGIINCGFLMTSGRLADIYGRKKIFLLGLSFSGTGMVSGGLSPGIGGLVASMCLAGLGNAVLLPVSQTMMVTEFPKSQKSRAVAIWASTVAYAMAMGPLVAGTLSNFFDWRWVFWLTIPFFAISSLCILLFTKESKNNVDCPKLDLKGMLLIGLCLSSFVILLTEFNHLSLLLTVIFAGVVIVSFWKLWKHSHLFSSPLLIPELIKKKKFLGASIASACLVFYIWSTFFLLPIFLQNVQQLSSLTTGLLMLGITIPVILFSPIIGNRYQPRRAWLFISSGFLFLLFSSCLQIFLSPLSSLLYIFLTHLLYGVGYALISGPSTTAAIATVPPYRAGIASGTFVTFQEIGGTIGLAFVVTIVRLNSSLEIGFQKGCYILLIVSFIGIFCGFLLKSKRVHPEIPNAS